jgi:uncharacterized protein (TIGR03067 family)
MRTLLFLALFVPVAVWAGGHRGKKKPKNLDGTWVPQREELAGKPIPAAAFAALRMVIADSLYTVTAESVDKGVVRYKGGKMDIYGREGVNAGKHFTAIYKYEGEQLTICYNLDGDVYPESFATEGHPMFFLSVFNKQVKK